MKGGASVVKGACMVKGRCAWQRWGMGGKGGCVWQGGMHGRGHVWQGGRGGMYAGETATEAGGTHSTGMLSYLNMYLHLDIIDRF